MCTVSMCIWKKQSVYIFAKRDLFDLLNQPNLLLEALALAEGMMFQLTYDRPSYLLSKQSRSYKARRKYIDGCLPVKLYKLVIYDVQSGRPSCLGKACHSLHETKV